MTNNFHKIIVLGQTGDGKSTFCNYILGEKQCKESDGPNSETKKINAYASTKEKNKDIIMIDTPGLSDSDGEDQEIIDKIRTEIRDNHCKGIKSIIIMHNFNVLRLCDQSKKLLFIYSKLFPIPEFWQHVGIVFSFSYEGLENFEKMKDAKITKFMPDFIKNVEKIIEEGNKIGKQIEMPGEGGIQCFFTDCGKIIPGNRTDQEIDRLIRWTRDLNYLDINENDLDGQVFANCKSKKQIEDVLKNDDPVEVEVKIELEEKKKIAKAQKCIIKHYKQYEIKDFHDNTSNYIESKSYSEDTNYYVTIEWKDEVVNKKNISEDKMTVNKTLIYFRQINRYDKDLKLIEPEGKIDPYNKEHDEKFEDKIFTTKEPVETRERVEEVKEDKYFNSDSELQKYYNNLRKMNLGGKILFIGFNILHFIAGIGHLVGWVVSKFQKPRRWKQTITHKKIILEKHIINIDIFHNEYDHGWEFVKVVKDLPDEYSMPIRI